MDAYTISYNICSLVFLTVIAAHFYLRNRLNSKQNSIFGALIAVAILDIVMDTVTAVTIARAQSLPHTLNMALNTFFYLLQCTLPLLMLLYVAAMLGGLKKRNAPRIAVCCIPYAYFVVTTLLNPVTKMYFYFENGEYIHAPLFFTLFIGAALYMLLSVSLLYIYRRRISAAQLITVTCFVVLTAAVVILQNVFFPQYLLSGMAVALSVFMMYLTFQNPEELRDDTTGCFNRRALAEFCREGQVNAEKFYGAVFQVDNLGAIGDSLGSVTAMKAMAAFTEAIKKDAPKARRFRIGEDRILMICGGEGACRVAVGLTADRAAGSYLAGGAKIGLSVSVCCFYGVDMTGISTDILAAVDCSADRMKRMGKRLFVMDGSHAEIIRREAEIARELKRCVAEDGMKIYFQPIYSAKRGGIASAEVLVRMAHPEYGIIRPGELIPIAERSGCIVEQERQILRKTCRFIRANSLDNGKMEHVEVNISPLELLSDGFAEALAGLLREYDIRPEFLVLGITEAQVAVSQQEVLQKLNELRELGVKLLFNCYGMGFASMNNIVGMPYSIVKLDSSTVPEFYRGGAASSVFRHTVQLLDELGIETAVGGIEDDFQLELMKRLGVGYIQGHCFSRPMSADEYADYLRGGCTK